MGTDLRREYMAELVGAVIVGADLSSLEIMLYVSNGSGEEQISVTFPADLMCIEYDNAGDVASITTTLSVIEQVEEMLAARQG